MIGFKAMQGERLSGSFVDPMMYSYAIGKYGLLGAFLAARRGFGFGVLFSSHK